jgi:hypothetical protein
MYAYIIVYKNTCKYINTGIKKHGGRIFPIKKYMEESTNKYIQSIVKNDKVIEFIKTPIKCELCYLNDEHKLSDSEIIFFRNKFY